MVEAESSVKFATNLDTWHCKCYNWHNSVYNPQNMVPQFYSGLVGLPACSWIPPMFGLSNFPTLDNICQPLLQIHLITHPFI